MNRLSATSGSPLDSSDAPAAARRPRVVWLDLFRGVAVLVMIETHVVNTFLAAGLRQSAWFPVLNYLNGLVAPSFLFIAGFMVGMERRTAPGKPLQYQRRATRLLGLVALSQFLHFPWTEVLQQRWAEAWRVGTQLNVLPCLAIGLGMLLALAWLAEKLGDSGLRQWWGGIVALTMILVIGAPFVVDWTNGPVLLRAVVNQTTGSLFPIFPWAGFVLFGALAGAWPERPLHERAAGLLGLLGLAWFCRGAVFSSVSPAFFLERVAWVLVLAALVEAGARTTRPGVVLFAGKHALKLYVAHLVFITVLVGVGLPRAASGWPLTLGALAVVLATSLVTARFFARRTQTQPAMVPRTATAADVPSPAT